jgi:3'-5' exoribonuclease
MKRLTVASLQPGQRVESSFLVHSKERKMASSGSAYLDLSLRDATGIVSAKLWDCDRHATEFEAEDIVEVQGEVEAYRGTTQIKVRKIARASLAPAEIDWSDYLPRSERDPEEMFEELLERVRALPEGPVRKLLLAIFEDAALAEKYKRAPAATTYHHAYLGGLVEHVLTLTQLADKVCDHYEFLRRDLVLAGILLHDIGKIEELGYARGFSYTARGQLIGHITLGAQIVREKIRELPDFPAPLADQIEHIILSHHGELEFGSPKQPLFPEALVVHLLDNMDSKLASMRAQYAAEKDRPGDFTSRNPALRRELFKPPESKTD